MPSAHAQWHCSIEIAKKHARVWCVCIIHICLPNAPVTVHTGLYVFSVCWCDCTELLSRANFNHHDWVYWQADCIGANCHGPTTSKLHTQRVRHTVWKLTHVSMLCISLETSSSPVQQTQPGYCKACCVCIGCFPALITSLRVVWKQSADQEGLPRYIRSQLVKTTSKLSGFASSSQASPALKVMLPM